MSAVVPHWEAAVFVSAVALCREAAALRREAAVS